MAVLRERQADRWCAPAEVDDVRGSPVWSRFSEPGVDRALRGSVDDLYVIPEARGQSLATSLLSEVRKFAVKRDIRALGVEIGPEDDRARRLYAGAGYAESDHRSMILSLAAPLHETEP